MYKGALLKKENLGLFFQMYVLNVKCLRYKWKLFNNGCGLDVTKIPDVTSQCLLIWNMHRTSGKVETWVIMPPKQMIALDGPAGALSHLSSHSIIIVLIPHADSLLRNCSIWGPVPRSQQPNKEVEWMCFISELEMFPPFREDRRQAVSCSDWSQLQQWQMGNHTVTVK